MRAGVGAAVLATEDGPAGRRRGNGPRRIYLEKSGAQAVGIWDWIVGALSGNAPKEPSRTAPRGRTTSFRESATCDTGVATLEPPGAVGPVGPVGETDGGWADEDESDLAAPWWAPAGVVQIEPVPLERPDLCTEARVLENLLVSHFDGHNLTLPTLPHVPERVLRRLGNIRFGLAEVSKDISEDQVIAAEVIRMANSPLYRGLHRMTTLQPAVTRLGGTAIKSLMLNHSLRAATFNHRGVDRELATLVWHRSLATAYIARGLASLTSFDPEDAFLAGLLHDIGNVIVLRVTGEFHATSGYDIDVDTFEYFCSECHQEFGELLADAWNLPDALRNIITDHHTFPDEGDPLRTERLLILLSDMIGQVLGYGPPAAYNLAASRPAVDLGLSGRPDFTRFLDELPGQLDEALMSFGGTSG